jgi:N-acetylneuraminic acid mutarotase
LTYALATSATGATGWTRVASDEIWRAAACAAEGLDGRIYVFGGFDSGGVGMSRPSVYDPATDSWTVLFNAPMPTARGLCAATRAPDGTILVLGGINCDPGVGAPCGGESSLAAVEAFDPTSQSWSVLPPMGQLRDRLGVATGSDGRIYAVGGESFSLSQRSPAQSAEAYDPVAGAWTPIASLNAPRIGLQLVSDVDGQLYAIGGDADGTVEVYAPGVDGWVR